MLLYHLLLLTCMLAHMLQLLQKNAVPDNDIAVVFSVDNVRFVTIYPLDEQLQTNTFLKFLNPYIIYSKYSPALT